MSLPELIRTLFHPASVLMIVLLAANTGVATAASIQSDLAPLVIFQSDTGDGEETEDSDDEDPEC